MLEIEDLHVHYGSIPALRGISLFIPRGEVVALLGSNGAGKSTTLKTISGLLKPKQGTMRLNGERIDGLPPYAVVQKGVSHVPEGRRIFNRMTVRENLEMGAYTRRDGEIARDMERVFELFPRLAERCNQVAGTLSGGEQQMLAIGRALMSNPSLLLMDEPSLGLAPRLVEMIFRVIEEIRSRGTTIFLVEQNALMALSVARMAYVLETGQIVGSGEAAVLLRDPKVRQAYLGEPPESAENPG
ncbi:MAG: ABC transporter ATP-binding protein [Candidatus Tectomicrobia bacterium]|uniref:ABC transporter ATP-binding protein n=1 Tax=Tectimicrobiota bacterium TaxID=2528274 RepID=A0A932M0C9_UNCTE|nr:ABC transporter ATP-binding protein [Candidatus Tectomicrobia bacterium]